MRSIRVYGACQFLSVLQRRRRSVRPGFEPGQERPHRRARWRAAGVQLGGMASADVLLLPSERQAERDGSPAGRFVLAFFRKSVDVRPQGRQGVRRIQAVRRRLRRDLEFRGLERVGPGSFGGMLYVGTEFCQIGHDEVRRVVSGGRLFRDHRLFWRQAVQFLQLENSRPDRQFDRRRGRMARTERLLRDAR